MRCASSLVDQSRPTALWKAGCLQPWTRPAILLLLSRPSHARSLSVTPDLYRKSRQISIGSVPAEKLFEQQTRVVAGAVRIES